MEKISELTVCEFKYVSEEERSLHVKKMESNGFVCPEQIKTSAPLSGIGGEEYYWYGKYTKRFSQD